MDIHGKNWPSLPIERTTAIIPTPTASYIVRCSHCLRGFYNHNEWTLHKEVASGFREDLVCVLCDKRFQKAELLSAHVAAHIEDADAIQASIRANYSEFIEKAQPLPKK
jgi:hypothetical protein